MKQIAPRAANSLLKLLLVAVVLSVAYSTAWAQAVAAKQPDGNDLPTAADGLDKPVKPADVSGAVDERLRVLEEELREQRKTLGELRALVSEQQRVIASLSPAAVPQTSAETKEATVTTANAAANPATTAQNQTPSIDDRVKKLEGQVMRIGPFRFSGDFRLRFDGIFRKAEPAPPAGFAPLTHEQNARVRYRLRLNLDTDIDPNLSFHMQLATGPFNNPLSTNQDFGSTTARHPFLLSEAWVDYHPNKSIQLQGGRVQNVFGDNSRFLFDDDIRFNGFNEKYTFFFKNNALKVSSLEFRAGQYILSNPNVAIVTAGSPLAQAGAVVGTTGRSANLFQQGFVVNQKYNDRWNSNFAADIQLYRNPNQIQLASTANGVALIVQNGLGVALSGPLAGNGTATTTPGGAIYTARSFQIARLSYRLNWTGFQRSGHDYPVMLNFQAARNVGIGLNERDAMLAALQVGRATKRGDLAFLYLFTIKGANALISQLTDDDLGTNSGVNIRTHHLRFDLGLTRKVTFQSLFFMQKELRNSGQFPNFFVPLNAFTPRMFRIQEQIVFNF
ncbi:MAG TPA: putative porin [Pyrinomonadaceae bacterium]|nr:putative porin [Pyrinomonadaceae bacterium]